MKRYLSIIMILFGFVFSHFASASEWEVKGGDTIWKILAEACQVVPSMKKVRIFARAVGIQTPDHVVIGERIDVSRGCTALSDVPSASLEKVVVLSAQQGETLRAIQAKTAALETEARILRVKFEASDWSGTLNQTALRLSDDQRQPEMNVGIARGLSSNMEAFVQGGMGAKGYHAFGDPVYFFKGFIILAVGFSLFVWAWSIWKRTVSEVDSNRNDEVLPSRMPLDFVLPGTANTAPVDSGLQFLGTFEKGFITLSVPFPWEMDLRFNKRVRSIHTQFFWCIAPVFVDGRGYGTFETDASGNCMYVDTIDAFKQSVEKSIRLFSEDKSDLATSRRIVTAMKWGLLRSSE